MAKILVVDDEKSLRITLSLFLENENHIVITASNFDEAILILEKNKPDLIITDIIMPGKTGLELLKYIREMDKNVPVIIMTGEPTVESAIIGIQQSASDYISKPVNRIDFLSIVNRTLKIKSLNDEKERLLKENEYYQKNLEKLVFDKTEDLMDSYVSIINLLAKVVEYRDPYTAGHQRRVGNLAADIGKCMGLNDSIINNLRAIGYIHDIGKINVPSELLAKPGLISNLERLLIQEHTRVGFEILNNSNLPDIYSRVVLQHHERFNGSGYPFGLKGDEIHLESNILIVSDVVEAMISHRPYRAARTLEETLEEIVRNRGILYHPDVVDCCIKLFDNCNYKIDDKLYKLNIKK